VHPDAHYDPRFLKALQTSVRRARPPAARTPWWKLLLGGVVGVLLLSVLVIMLTGLGVAAANIPAIPAAFGLFLAAMAARPPAEMSNRAAFLQPLAGHPAAARHVLHWLRRAEMETVCVFPAIALTSAVLYLIASRSSVNAWLPVLAVAAAAGLIASGVYALLHFWPALRPLRVLAFLICLGTFLTLKAKDEAGSAAVQFVVLLNPIHWPLPALQRPLAQAEGLRLAAGLTGSLAVLFLAWRHLPRYAARDVAKLDLTDATSAPDVRRAKFTVRLPAFLAGPPASGAPGFWERLVDLTFTPRQRVLAELSRIPGAPPLGWFFLRWVLGLLLIIGGAVLWSVFIHQGTAVLAGAVAAVIFTSKKFLNAPCADGFPFHALVRPAPLPAGQSVMPLALWPVPWRDLTALYLKSLWPRCVLFGCLLIPPGAALDLMLHSKSVRPVSGFPLTTGALTGTLFTGIFAVLSFTHALGSRTGVLRRMGWHRALEWIPVLPLQVVSFISGIAAVVMTMYAFSDPGVTPLALTLLVASPLSAAAAHWMVLRLLERGDIDLWMTQTSPPRL